MNEYYLFDVDTRYDLSGQLTQELRDIVVNAGRALDKTGPGESIEPPENKRYHKKNLYRCFNNRSMA